MYWRVLFDYPPFNIVDATIFEGLQEAHIESVYSVAVTSEGARIEGLLPQP